MAETVIKIAFHPKSSWQKDDCINRFKEYECPNPSTLQAVVVEGIPEGFGVTIRCCEEQPCKDRATDLAKHSAAGMLNIKSEDLIVRPAT